MSSIGSVLRDKKIQKLAATVAILLCLFTAIPAHADPLLIMPLGDSITDGTDAQEQSGYRGPLYNDLTADGFNFQFVGATNTSPGYLPTSPVDQTFHNGYPGISTSGLLSAMQTQAFLNVNPNIVLLHIGTNNVGGSEPAAVSDVSSMIDMIESHNASTMIFLAQIVPFPGHDSFVNQYNADLAALANTKDSAGDHVVIVDMNTNFFSSGNTLSPDNEHPNAGSYTWMAQQWNNAIVASLAPTGVHTWDASGTGAHTDGSGTWDTTSNNWWNGTASVPWVNANNDVATFGTFNGSAGTVTLGTGINVGGITFNLATSGTYTIAGNTLTLGGTSAPITANANATISSAIAGPAVLVKQGLGTLTLTGQNTYGAGTQVNQGTLSVPSLASGSPLGTGAVVLNGGTLRLAGQATNPNLQQILSVSGYNNDIVWSNAEASASLSYSAATTAQVASWVWYEKGVTGSQGLPVDDGSPTAREFTSVVNSSVQFQFAPYGTAAARSNNGLVLTAGANGSLTLAAPGSFQKIELLTSTQGNGAGTTWSATLNFSDGSHTVEANLNDPDWTAATSYDALTSTGLYNGGLYAGVLDLREHDFVLSAADQAKTLNSISFNTVSSTGNGWVVFAASGLDVNTAVQSFANDVSVTADSTIDVESTPTATMGKLAIGSNKLSLTGITAANLTLGATTLSGNPTFDQVAGTTLTLGALADGGTARTITKSNSGTLVLSAAAASLVNGTQVNVTGGTLRLGAADALGNLAAVDVGSGSSLSLGANQTVGVITNSGGVVLNGNTLTVGGANNLSGTFAGSISDGSGPGTLIKAGSGGLVLTGANSHTGGTIVNQGMLTVSKLSGVNSLGAAPVTLNGGTLRLAGQSTPSVQQQIVGVNGFTQDLIWGNGEAATAAAATTTNFSGWCWYEQGIPGTTQGLPVNSGAAPRTFTSVFNPSVQFQFADYGSSAGRNNNTLVVGNGASSALNLTTPGSFQSIQFLETCQSGGNGALTTWHATLNFSDGSTTTLSNATDIDWTVDNSHNALTATGLVSLPTGSPIYSNTLDLREYDFSLSAADQAKTLNSVTFTTVSTVGVGLAVFAVSGQEFVNPVIDPAQSYGNTVTVTADSTIDVQTSAAATMGNLSIGANKLSLTGMSGASLTVGTTTLSGNATFDPAAGTTLALGAVSDGGAGVGITKTNAGALNLTAAGNYSGPTIVNAGTLRVTNPSGSATGSSIVTIGDGVHSATLAGSAVAGQGAISGPVTIKTAAGISATSGATLTLSGGLTLNTGSISTFLLNGTPNGSDPANALIVTSGGSGGNSLVVNGTHTVNLDPTGIAGAGVYDLISFTGTAPAIGQFSLGTVLGGGFGYSLSLTGNQLDLTVAVNTTAAWNFAGNGAFSESAKWDPIQLPNSAGLTATFGGGTSTLINNTTVGGNAISVTVDGADSVGAIVFNNATVGYTLASDGVTGHGLTLDSGVGAGSSVTVNSGSHTIAANLTLADAGGNTFNLASGTALTVSSAIGEIGGSRSLTLSGGGTLHFGSANTFSGGATVNAGTLTTATDGGLGTGPLAVNSSGGATLVTLAGSETLSGLSGTISGGGTARVSVAAGKSLTINQAAGTTTFDGTVALASGPAPHGGAVLNVSGLGTQILTRAPAFGDHSTLNVNSGTLRIAASSGASSVGSGAVANLAAGTTLELAGSVSALGMSAAANRVDIANGTDSTTTVLVSGGTQQVGGIDGQGNVQVNAAANLTANHITAGALVIGGDAANSAVVTIAASDANGDPLATSGFALAGSLATSSPFGSGVADPSSLLSAGGAAAGTASLGDSASGGGAAAVPEPSSMVLLCLGVLSVFGFCRRQKLVS